MASFSRWTILRNSPEVLEGNEFKAENFGLGAQLSFLPLLMFELIGGEAVIIEFLPGADQVKTQTQLKRLELAVEEVVADKGYHSGAVLTELHEQEFRSYIPEPDRGRRKWHGEGKQEEQKANV